MIAAKTWCHQTSANKKNASVTAVIRWNESFDMSEPYSGSAG